MKKTIEASLVYGSLTLLIALYIPVFVMGFRGPNTWAWNELHINYAGGFVRRGLLGEVAYLLQTWTGLSTSVFFGVTFMLMTLLEIWLLFRLLTPFGKRSFVRYLVFLSPSLLLFAVNDSGAYMRKEIFVSLGLLGHSLLVSRVWRGEMTEERYRRILILCVLPYLLIVTLIHEIQLFFLPAHAVLITAALPRFRLRSVHIAAGLALVFVMMLLIVTHLGNESVVRAICDSWKGRAQVDCTAFSGIGSLAWPFENRMRQSAQVVASGSALLIWFVAAALSMLPIVALYVVLRSESGTVPSIGALLIVLLAALPIFFIGGWDWGRWLHLSVIAGVAVLLSRVPNMAERPHHRPLPVTAMLVGVLLYVTMWRLPHVALPANISGWFGWHLMRALHFYVNLI